MTLAGITEKNKTKLMPKNQTVGGITNAQYAAALRKAVSFRNELAGGSDLGYTDPEINFIALESMILGWISAQKWFQNSGEELLVANDWALQIAYDAVGEQSPKLKHWSDSTKMQIVTVSEAMRHAGLN